jgi:hypothetical protein
MIAEAGTTHRRKPQGHRMRRSSVPLYFPMMGYVPIFTRV